MKNKPNRVVLSEATTYSISTKPIPCSDPKELLDLHGDSLVDKVVKGDLKSCIYGLYDASLVGSGHFTDKKLQTIVEAINQYLISFDGTDESGAVEVEKLVSYLRAAHWSESSAGSQRKFTDDYMSELLQLFDGYFKGSHFIKFTGESSRNFMLRYEILVLLNSSQTDRLQFMPRISEALLGYARTVDHSDKGVVPYEERGVTQLLTQYFYSVNFEESKFERLLLKDPAIIFNLRDFVLHEGVWLVGRSREYHWADAVNELGRLLKFHGVIANIVRPALKEVLTSYSFGGQGSLGWLNAQNMVRQYDSQNCADYGDVCDFDLESEILSESFKCSDSVKVRFQPPLDLKNMKQTCTQLEKEKLVFDARFKSPNPVQNDYNNDLEVVVFKSPKDYRLYGALLFNINTDNGGMYLEGDPFDRSNQARFIAYQATWLPDFAIWNLEHEYIHYLDARYNLWGSFSDQPANVVWWTEGLAEYLSKGNQNPEALELASDKTYSLGDLFQTTYSNGDTDRIYHWGYLATRFMFERHRESIEIDLLPTLRSPKYPVSDEICPFNWGWRQKTVAIENNWLWRYDDSERGKGFWVWTCGQSSKDIEPVPHYTPYGEIIRSFTESFDDEFFEWIDILLSKQDQVSH
ncbi:collagenase [Pseudobacteriovorax antillogorgiicola]|nr:collagenase [Pseudobacteriovorax antillogorgiicola]